MSGEGQASVPLSLGELAEPVVFSPARWRTVSAVVAVAVFAAFLLLCALALPNHIWWLAFATSVLWLPTLWYTGGMTRRVTVRPGVSVERRQLFGGTQRVPIDATTEIVTFTRVITQRKLPGKVLDAKWFVLRSRGVAEMRLSGQYWSLAEITGLARTAPTLLRIRAEPTTVRQILDEYPDHFAPIEHRPAAMWWGMLIMIFGCVPSVMCAIAGFYSLIYYWWPAPLA